MPEVSLEFISRQITLLRDHVDRRLDAIEAQVGMLNGMLTRLDSADTGIQAELRGVRQMVQGHDQRIRRLEDASTEG